MSKAESQTEHRTVKNWSSEHGIDAWMLPLETRKQDPMQIIADYSEYIDGMAEYQATFTSTDVGRELRATYADKITELFLLRPVGMTQRKNRYVNPQYAHLGHHEPSIKDMDERLAFYDRFKRSPLADGAFFAAHFGLADVSIATWMHKREIDWKGQLKENLERTGRTLHTIAEWDNNAYRQVDLARLFPANTRTVRDWMLKYGSKADDWTPPEYPAGKNWFRRMNGTL